MRVTVTGRGKREEQADLRDDVQEVDWPATAGSLQEMWARRVSELFSRFPAGIAEKGKRIGQEGAITGQILGALRGVLCGI